MSQLSQTEGEPRLRLIVGLGNPGERYRQTRHNLGFQVVIELARRWQVQFESLECNALIAETDPVLLAMPQTYMNRSGFAVRCLQERRGVSPENILVIYDDVNLELGRLRLRRQGGPGGHRGMESIIQNLRTEVVPRLRLGIRSTDVEVAAENLMDYVLSPFAAAERQHAIELVERAADACKVWLDEGAEATMNRFNC